MSREWPTHPLLLLRLDNVWAQPYLRPCLRQKALRDIAGGFQTLGPRPCLVQVDICLTKLQILGPDTLLQLLGLSAKGMHKDHTFNGSDVFFLGGGMALRLNRYAGWYFQVYVRGRL